MNDRSNVESLTTKSEDFEDSRNVLTKEDSLVENLSVSSKVNQTEEYFTCPAPFCFEERATKEREKCDYSIRITLEMVHQGEAPRKIRILAIGTFDLFHIGHGRLLMEAKNVFKNVYLIVGVHCDRISSDQDARTVLNEIERYESVRHSRYVDEVIPGAPRTISEEFLNEHKIDFIISDLFPNKTNADDYFDDKEERPLTKETRHKQEISTSDIISRLLRDYDLYVRRNLSRGYSPQDLNIGFIKTKQIQLQSKIEKFKDFCHDDDRQKALLEHWENRSKELIHNFLSLFAARSVVNLIQRTFSMTEDESSQSENENV